MWAHIFRPKRRRHGKVYVGRSYHLRYWFDGMAKPAEISLFTSDRLVAEEKKLALVKEKQQEAAGILPPKVMRDAAQRRLSDHLADLIAERKAVGKAPMYLYNLGKHVEKLLSECKWVFPKDVTAESFEAWREGKKLAAKTLNDYLADACRLFNWMRKRGRIQANPLASVDRLKVVRDESPWRALSDEEVSRLLKVAGARKAVYLLGLVTGLRRSELDELQWGDVHLDALKPFLRVRASTTKNSKRAVLWLRDDAAAELRKIRPADVTAGVKVFASGVPSMEVFREDLTAAGIADVDEHGRKVVLHSLRHTLATNLAKAGVAPRLAMEVMRHSDLRLTMNVYTDRELLPTAEVVDKLPRFDEGGQAAVVAATGTNGAGEDTHRNTHGNTQTGVRGSPAGSAVVREFSAGCGGKSLGDGALGRTESAAVHSSLAGGGNCPTRIRMQLKNAGMLGNSRKRKRTGINTDTKPKASDFGVITEPDDELISRPGRRPVE